MRFTSQRSFTRRTRLVVCVLAVGLTALTFPPSVQAQQEMRLNYVNADIRDVIRSLATVLGVNVLLSEDVPAKRVTYTTPAPVPVNEVGAVLEAILDSEGLVLVRRGPVAEVMPAESAPATGPIFFGKQLPDPLPLGLITQIVPLQYIRADEAIAMLEQLASPIARIETVPRSNSVLITDRATNIDRYLELLQQLDVRSEGEGGLRTYVYRLRHATANQLAQTLAQIFGVTAPSAPGPTRQQALADRSLSQTLQQFRLRELQSLEQRGAMQVPIEFQVGAAAADTTGQAREITGLVGLTTIVPDPATNSLVIRTSPPNYPVLQETIEALDIRPAQVLLEVMIAEITLDESTRYGIDWSIFASDVSSEELEIAGRLGRPQRADSLAGVDDFVARVVRLGRVDYDAVLQALASEVGVQVLSTPHVLALNNELARILVGSEVPFTASTLSGFNDVVSVQYRNVGTQLTIIPTINQDGYVTFRILQEVSSLTQQTIEAALGAPVITTREAETSALVRNGRTIVIGGLIDESSEETESGIPLLRDVPLLGYLFKSRTTSRLRTELAIFVTPHVVFSDEDADALLERERERMKNLEGMEEPPPQDSGGRM